MRITLPRTDGRLAEHELTGTPLEPAPGAPGKSRVFLAAAHVVADPLAPDHPEKVAVDWEATLAFRRHLDGLGLGIAEAMDTAQRGAGLDWGGALELITRTRAELPEARVFCGVGTDHLDVADARDVDEVIAAWRHQLEAVQRVDGRVILMASRAMARVANGAEDYLRAYGELLADCERPVILHWLGEMFDPALAGYWGDERFEPALETVLAIIEANVGKIDGIKLSLLDRDKEIALRRRLPASVKMYTGDDFNYAELIEGDGHAHSHALLGIFDPLAGAAAAALAKLDAGDAKGFREILDPTVPLARRIFRAPTRHYKTGVVFLAWLNGFQEHFVMLDGAQSRRPLTDFAEIFRLADRCGVLRDPELAVERMRHLLALHGVR